MRGQAHRWDPTRARTTSAPTQRTEQDARPLCCIQKTAAAAMPPGQPMLAPPVDNLKLVTAYPKARATMNDTKLRKLVPSGTPIVMHLYTG